MSSMRFQLPVQRVSDVSVAPIPSRSRGAFSFDNNAAPPIDQRKSDPWISHLVNVAKLVYEISDDKECPKKLSEFLTSQGCTEVKWFDRWITQAVGYVRDGHRC